MTVVHWTDSVEPSSSVNTPSGGRGPFDSTFVWLAPIFTPVREQYSRSGWLKKATRSKTTNTSTGRSYFGPANVSGSSLTTPTTGSGSRSEDPHRPQGRSTRRPEVRPGLRVRRFDQPCVERFVALLRTEVQVARQEGADWRAQRCDTSGSTDNGVFLRDLLGRIIGLGVRVRRRERPARLSDTDVLLRGLFALPRWLHLTWWLSFLTWRLRFLTWWLRVLTRWLPRPAAPRATGSAAARASPPTTTPAPLTAPLTRSLQLGSGGASSIPAPNPEPVGDRNDLCHAEHVIGAAHPSRRPHQFDVTVQEDRGGVTIERHNSHRRWNVHVQDEPLAS